MLNSFDESINHGKSPFRFGSILDYYKSIDPKDIVKSNGKDIDHLTPDGKLPHGWEASNNDFTYQIEREYDYLNCLWIVFGDSENNLDFLRFLVNYMKDIMKLCDSLGECFTCWRTIKLFRDSEFIDMAGMLVYLEEGLNKNKGKL